MIREQTVKLSDDAERTFRLLGADPRHYTKWAKITIDIPRRGPNMWESVEPYTDWCTKNIGAKRVFWTWKPEHDGVTFYFRHDGNASLFALAKL